MGAKSAIVLTHVNIIFGGGVSLIEDVLICITIGIDLNRIRPHLLESTQDEPKKQNFEKPHKTSLEADRYFANGNALPKKVIQPLGLPLLERLLLYPSCCLQRTTCKVFLASPSSPLDPSSYPILANRVFSAMNYLPCSRSISKTPFSPA